MIAQTYWHDQQLQQISQLLVRGASDFDPSAGGAMTAPDSTIGRWSLTSLREEILKIGAAPRTPRHI